MSEHVFDAFTRRAAQALDRRAVLEVFAGAAAAAVAALSPFLAEAKGKIGGGKGNGKGKRKRKRKRSCAGDGNNCRADANGLCNTIFLDPSEQ
jgi:hypothetical protein